MVVLNFRDDPPGRLFIATEDLPTFSIPVDYAASSTLEDRRKALSFARRYGALTDKLAELLLKE